MVTVAEPAVDTAPPMVTTTGVPADVLSTPGGVARKVGRDVSVKSVMVASIRADGLLPLPIWMVVARLNAVLTIMVSSTTRAFFGTVQTVTVPAVLYVIVAVDVPELSKP